MINSDEERFAVNSTVEIIEYIPNAVVIKTKINKSKGDISFTSFNHGEGLKEKESSFNKFIQIIEGKTIIVIDGAPIFLGTGQSLTIPAHTKSMLRPSGHFKMIQTTIKKDPLV